MTNKVSNVIIWGKNVGGFCSSLQTGLKKLGLELKIIGPKDYKEYASSRTYPPFGRMLEFLKMKERRWFKKKNNHDYFFRLNKLLGFSIKLFRYGLLIFSIPITIFWLAFKFDVLIFNFGSTVTNTSIELWFYKFVGRRVVFVFHGSEIRPKYLNGKKFSTGQIY